MKPNSQSHTHTHTYTCAILHPRCRIHVGPKPAKQRTDRTGPARPFPPPFSKPDPLTARHQTKPPPLEFLLLSLGFLSGAGDLPVAERRHSGRLRDDFPSADSERWYHFFVAAVCVCFRFQIHHLIVFAMIFIRKLCVPHRLGFLSPQ